MDSLAMQTPNLVDKNIEKILELFPNVATEVKNENGDIKKIINFEKLKQELSENVVDGEECYDFNWVGKRQAIIESNRTIRKTLRPQKDKSVNWDTTKNIYIEGDNLEALKLLQESYFKKVKLIYIDPPYNTGMDFVYRDNFVQDKESYFKDLGIKDDEGNRLFKNIESNGRFHSDWCSMIYPRLKLARNLLDDDGLIFISIDDNEVDNLKKICDEVFGRENFVAEFIIDKTAQGANQSLTFKTQHEYCLLYTKKEFVSINYDVENELDTKKFKYKDSKGNYAITNSFDSINSPLSSNKNRGYTVYYNRETEDAVVKDEYDKETETFGDYDDELINKGYTPIRPGIRNGVQYPWNWMKSRFLEQYKEELVFQENKYGKLAIYHKNRNSGTVKDTTLKKFDTRQDGNMSLINLMGAKLFDYPKSVEMLKWVLSKYKGKDYTVLDFFSGSATTAHAVMQLNAEDGGNRNFIMVQLPEILNEKSEAYKLGYHTICDIGEERVRRAGKKIAEEYPDRNIDVGFRVFKVDDTNMKDVYYSPSDINQLQLDMLEDNIKDDRSDDDLLYEVLLNTGVELSLFHRIETIEGKRLHYIQSQKDSKPELIACFEPKLPETLIRKIAEENPVKVVFRDSSFNDDANRINVEEIFKLVTPETEVKVL